jgi:hypothetical protein
MGPLFLPCQPWSSGITDKARYAKLHGQLQPDTGAKQVYVRVCGLSAGGEIVLGKRVS